MLMDGNAMLFNPFSAANSNELRYAALGAHTGGALPVRLVDREGGKETHKWQLEQPHFVAIIRPTSSAQLVPGQTGVASLRCRLGPMGQVILRWLSNWVHSKREITKHL